MDSAVVEDYLKTIYLLGGQDRQVTNSALAERLGLTAASVTSMMQKLARPDLALLTYTPYQGVRLTAAGAQIALGVIRRHRLLELYLAERLGLRWDQVHEEAERLEHHLSPTVVARIAEALGHPQVDPHGHPIPTAAGEVAHPALLPLTALEPGQAAVIGSVNDDDPELLRYVAARGMYPGVPIQVLEREPFGGPLAVQVGPPHDLHRHTLGLAAAHRVQVIAGPAASAASDQRQRRRRLPDSRQPLPS